VFEADLSQEELQEVLRRAAKYLDKEDSLLAYPLCGACAAGVRSLGRPRQVPLPDGVIV
jgi:CRISPR/Cas system-associated endoribonuclease Cas2